MCADENNMVERRTAPTLVVLLLLVLAAAIFSYLWAYGVDPSLVAGHLAQPRDSDVDSRPRQMLFAFSAIFGCFLFFGGILRWTSHRQLRRIDAMSAE